MANTLRLQSLQIHPLARGAYECVAAVLPAQPIGVPRAVRRDGALTVFCGFAGLGGDWTVAPKVEHGLADEQIEAAAWAEVEAIWALLTSAPSYRKAVADALAATAPPATLQRLSLPEPRDPMRVRKALRLAARDVADPAPETIFARRKAIHDAKQRSK